MKKTACSLAIVLLVAFFVVPKLIAPAYAAVAVTTATGGSAISADTTGGTYTTLTGPVITEGANGDIGTGTIVITAPTGFVFNTGVTVTAAVGRVAGAKTLVTLSSPNATLTSTTITITVTAKDATGGNPPTRSSITFSNIQVRPSAGTPLASGNMTYTGSATIAGLSTGANLGTLTEVVGAKNKLALTTQPSSSALIGTDFATKPVVALQDQFGNTVTTDSTSTISRAVVLSTQACGGTAGSGTLTSTPANNTAVSSGVLTYTAMQYSAAESVKICFTSTGVTQVLSNAINVLSLPTVTTQAASNVQVNTATANGTITATGGENNDIQGFLYDTASHGSAPGNVAPGSVGYGAFAQNSGSFGTGAFTVALSSLNSGTTYYGRAYSHNSAGYSYSSGEVSFLTKPAAPTNVQATDGTYPDKVTVTWTKSTGATTYHVWRDTTDLTPSGTGDVATYDDTGAGAPSITPGNSAATDGSSLTGVNLSLSGTAGNNGTTHTYKVVAYNATGNSVDSATNTGYRGAGTLSYQWQVSAADSDAGYSDISGATTASYNYTGAPPDGSGRYYRCTISATGVTSQTSAADRGFVGVVSISLTTDGIIDYGQLSYNELKNTIDLSDTQTAQNDGNIPEDFYIKSSDATGGTGWTLNTTPDVNKYVHEFSTDGNSWTKFIDKDTYGVLMPGVGVDATQNFDLRLTAPSFSDATEKTVTITILATQQD